MKAILTTLTKIFVREFYRAHASNFLVVLGFAAGFMRGEDHIALGESLIQSPFLLTIPITIWFVYTLMIMDFNTRTIRRNENLFLVYFNLFSRNRQWAFALSIGLSQLMPALLYGTFLAGLTIRHEHYFILSLIVISLTILTIMISWQVRYHLIHPAIDKSVSRLKQWINKTITRPYFLFSLEWVSRNQPLSVVGTKLTGWLVLWATLALYSTDDYDIRLLALGLTVAFASSIGVLIEWHRFDNFYFSISRQMPISIFNRICNLTLSLVIFFLPEAGLLITKFPTALNVVDGITACAYALSIPILFYSFLYVRDRTPDQIIPYVFFFGIAWLITILSSVPLAVISLVNFFLVWYWWKKYYYRFEYIAVN